MFQVVATLRFEKELKKSFGSTRGFMKILKNLVLHYPNRPNKGVILVQGFIK